MDQRFVALSLPGIKGVPKLRGCFGGAGCGVHVIKIKGVGPEVSIPFILDGVYGDVC